MKFLENLIAVLLMFVAGSVVMGIGFGLTATVAIYVVEYLR